MIVSEIIEELRRLKIGIKIKEGQLVLSGAKDKISAKLLLEIKENKLVLIDYVTSYQKQSQKEINQDKDLNEYYLLTAQQKSIWFASQNQESVTLYNQPSMFILEGNLNIEALKYSFKKIINTHESLRTSFSEVDGEPMQIALENVDIIINQIDLKTNEDINNVFAEFSSYVFDLSNPPLILFTIVKESEEKYYLLFNIHHIISDGWSVNIFFKELTENYSSYLEHRGLDENEIVVRTKFKEFVDWQHNYLNSPSGKTDLDFWKNKIGEDFSSTKFSTKSDYEGYNYNDGAASNFSISIQLSKKVNSFCRSRKITAFHFYSSALAILLSKYTGNKTITFGTPFSCRNNIKFNDVIGCFINTLPVSIKNDSKICFNDLLISAASEITEVFNHQNYPAEKIIEHLNLTQTSHKNPLFDIIIVYQNYSLKQYISNGLKINYAETATDKSKAGLVFRIFEENGTILLNIEYSKKLFDDFFIKQIANHFETLLINLLDNPTALIEDIEYLSIEEKSQLLNIQNNTNVNFPKDKTVIDYFAEQCKKRNKNIAVTINGFNLTYDELDKKSNRLANYLIQKLEVSTNKIIGIMTERNENLIIGIIAILKSGAAYLPINPEYPEARKQLMLSDTKCEIILSDNKIESKTCVFIPINEIIKNEKYDEKRLTVKVHILQYDPAYIIYTSGSSGKPKGVVVNHKNLVRLFFNDKQLFDFKENDVWTLFHSFSFDFSVWEIFGALLFGSRLVIVPDEIVHDPLDFYKLLEDEEVTVLNQTPSALYRLKPDSKFQLSLRYIIFGGEALQPRKLKEWKNIYPEIKMINMYGITETTIHVTYKEITNEDINLGISNIGKPIPTMGISIMDDDFNILPKGLSGQICVYGEGLSNGYLNQPELTNEKFKYISPFGLCYLSGDLGRILENGDIEYLGRIDDQVQIHGFRIELKEIENALTEISGIKNAVVLAIENESDINLHSFLVVEEGISNNLVRQELVKKIPSYMIPANFIFVEVIPLTSSGKTDKQALMKLKQAELKAIIKPKNDVESKILEAWKATLNYIEISTDENFFVIGGDSIKALKLVREINKRVNASLTIAKLYENNTIIKIAKLAFDEITDVFFNNVRNEFYQIINNSDEIIEKYKLNDTIEQVIPMSDIQRGMVYYSLKNPNSSIYHDQFVYQLYIKDFVLDNFSKAFEFLINKHSMLRTSFNMFDFPEDVQLIHKFVKPAFEFEDSSKCDLDEIENSINEYLEYERSQNFEIINPPLWRMKIVKTPDDIIVICWSFHHSIFDGWSNASFFTELLSVYKAISLEANYVPDFLKSSYIHYIAEQNIIKNSKEIVNFWQQELLDYKRLEIPKSEVEKSKLLVDEYSQELDSRIIDSVKKISADINTDMKTIFFSAFVYCMNLLTYENDILIGIVTNNRPNTEDSEKILGCFLNTIPFRIIIDSNCTWREYIDTIITKLNILKKYESLSLFEIAKHINATGKDANPLFDIMFNYIDFNIYENVYSDYSLESNSKKGFNLDGYDNTNTLLNFTVANTFQNPELKLSYNPSNISDEWVKRLAAYFNNILCLITKEIDEKITHHKILTNNDKLFFKTINRTEKNYDLNQTYIEVFEKNLVKHSNNIAVVYNNQKLTYHQLNTYSEKLSWLIKKGTHNNNEITALLTDSSFILYTGILAILKAGCAVLPISDGTPNERIFTILKDSLTGIIITSRSSLKKARINISEISDIGIKIILFDDIDFANIPPLQIIEEKKTSPNDDAYIVYTSGTTGNPKGIVFNHTSILNLCYWYIDFYSITKNDRFTKYSDINYDANIWEIFPALLCGSSIYTISDEIKLDMKRLNNFFENNHISVSWLPTPILEQFLPENNNSLRILTTGGDRLKNVIRQSYKIFNNYGPAENTVCASVYELNYNEENIPIGKPIANNKIYILKLNGLQLLPVGVVGEICLSGSSLSKGYLNDTDLTSKKFVFMEDGTRIYRTGDLGKFREDGNLEFLGRVDRQIKIRGQRLEIEEIESLLIKLSGIKEAVVTANVYNSSDNNELIAFVVRDDFNLSESQIEEYLLHRLPSFMIPSRIIFIEDIPLTNTGKINYKKLNAPKVHVQNEVFEFKNEFEKVLAEIWADVLKIKIELIDSKKNFFEQGGNSINLIQIQRKVNQIFETDIPITSFLKYTSLTKLASYIKELKANTINEEKENSTKTIIQSELGDIAVIGMACKFPGADNINEFWNNLLNGVEAISFFNDEELEKGGIPLNLISNKSYVKAVGVINTPETFDAAFFNYSDHEAEIMDPQIRLFHECVWSTLEDGGYNPENYKGRIGLFAGASKNNLWENLAANIEEVDDFSSTLLSSKENLATLVSYKLNLRGPSVNIYTACSTSLVAIHEACNSILSGECEMALCGGVNLSLPFVGGSLSGDGSVFSDDGHCRPFCAEGNGTIAGKGAGVVLLKPLNEAIKDNDNIYGVIKKSAVNNDGYQKIGFTAPSIDGQIELLKNIYNENVIKPESISYIETHGTGTELGDVVEIEALSNIFKKNSNKIVIGSVKSNIGHLDTAAGIAAFIKTVLMLKNKKIVQTLHSSSSNKNINFDKTSFSIANKTINWDQHQGKRIAGISSFGIGGTNAHIVVEEYVNPKNIKAQKNDLQIIPFSAKTPNSLIEYRTIFRKFIEEDKSILLENAAFKLQTCRKEFQYRSAVVCSDSFNLLKKLENNSSYSKIFTPANIIFMFPGQGTQYINMGRELYESQPEFKFWFDKCSEIIKNDINDLDIKKIIYQDKNINNKQEISETLAAHCALFVFEYSLAKLLISWGIKPSAMIGHSLGEYTAACLAGIISLEDSLKIVISRGKLAKNIPGKMLSIVTNENNLKLCMNEFNKGKEKIFVAAINSDSHFILSGDEKSIFDFNNYISTQGVEGKVLHIDFASHCDLVENIKDDFNHALEGIIHNKPTLPFVTNLDSRVININEDLPISYWREHLLNPVQFSKGLTNLISAKSHSILIEVGPASTLSTFAKNISSIHEKYIAISLIPHPKEDVDFQHYFYERIAALWCSGISLDWNAFNGNRQFQKVQLPTYCFDKTVYQIPKINKSKEYFDKHTPNSWYYISQWRQSKIPSGQKLQNKNIVIFADKFDVAQVISLQLSGNNLKIVNPGNSFKKCENIYYQINPSDDKDYDKLFTELKKENFIPNNILHLLSISNDANAIDYNEVIAGQNLGFISLVNIAKALADNTIEDVQITVIVNNLLDITGAEKILSKQSPILAAIKVIPQEFFSLKVHCLEFDFNDLLNRKEYYSQKIIDEIIDYSVSENYEHLTAYRNKKRWIQSYCNIEPKTYTSSSSRFKAGGVYIITGGAGNVGSVISSFLAESYNAKLIITGKTDLPDKKLWHSSEINLSSYQKKLISNLQKFENQGGEVTYFCTDVSSIDLMEQVFDYSILNYGFIDGIIHSAAAIKEKSISVPLSDSTLFELEEQFNIKVKGILAISELTIKYKVPFVMIASSTSSILGGIGFGCYAASNAFVNSFVKEKNLQDLTEWISLIWDGWYFPEYSSSLNEVPRESNIKSEDGLKILSVLNNLSEIDNLVISKRNINEEIRKWVSNIYKDEIAPKTEIIVSGKDRPFLINDYKKPESDTEKKICQIWEEFFRINGIGTEDHFYELGGDSLKAITVISIIHKRLGIRIPLTEFMKKPTITDLSLFIENSSKEEYCEIKPSAEIESYPLSSAQKRLFLLYSMDKDSLAYNINSSAMLEGSLDIVKLENAFRQLINRHMSLRTKFKLENGVPVQQIIDLNNIEFNIEFVDNENDFFRPFDLMQPPLIRGGIKQISENKNVLLIDTHHIISDAISMSICFKELSGLYNGIQFMQLPIQYKDYAVWQNKSLSQEFLINQKEFWKENLSGELPVLDFPLDFKRPTNLKHDGDSIVLEIKPDLLSSLKIIAQKNESTLFMLLLSAFNILLSKYSSQEDIIIGTPSAGRKNEELKNVIGMFANTLALRNKPDKNLCFQDFLKEVKENSLIAFENQDYQFEELVEELKVERDINRNPIFDVMFVYINIDFTSSEMTGIKIKPYELQKKISRFDLTLHCKEEKEKINLIFEYSSNLFFNETIKRMSLHFRNVLKSIVENNRILLKDISLVDKGEINQLASYNNTGKDFAEKYLTVTHLYSKQLQVNKDKGGILFDDDSRPEIKYSLFEKNVNKLTNRIINSTNIKLRGLVGVISERNEFMLYATLAILKTGNGYVPIDPNAPEERAKYVIDDSGCSAILCERKFKEFASKIYDGEIIVIEEILEEDSPLKKIEFPHVSESDPLFLLYTSGSTGKPKGVLMPHKPIINLLLWMREEYYCENERILFLNPYTFDMSIWGLYAWALNGSSVCILKDGYEKDPSKIVKAVKEKSITTILFVPSMLTAFLEYIEKYDVNMKDTKLKYVFVSGEILTKQLIDKFNNCLKDSETQLINFYGPTETHVVTHFRTNELNENVHISVPIGKPIANTKVLIVDKEQKIVPHGIVGEILLGGDCVADGYLNKEVLTNEKFISIENELTNGLERFYRTGDLGRWLNDGNIEFLGRNDFQIKIRGFRVEPGEIQAIINKIVGVKESLVLCKEIALGDKRLIAYVVYEDNKKCDVTFIRNELKKQAADYMVPSVIIEIEKFPLNSNGKIERKLLPEPIMTISKNDIITPRNKLEKRIAEIWSTILNINNIGIDDNFFDLGGHSLLIIRVHNQIEKMIDKKIEVVDLFRYPTIASLAEFINSDDSENNIIDKAAERAENQKKAREKRMQNSKRKGNIDE